MGGVVVGCREPSAPGGAGAGDDDDGAVAWGLTALRSTTVLLLVGGGGLDGDVLPSRGPSSLAASVDGGAARVSLNLEFFWAMWARAGAGSVAVAWGTAGGCLGGAP